MGVCIREKGCRFLVMGSGGHWREVAVVACWWGCGGKG